MLSAEARGAFWVRYTFTDCNGVIRQYRRPFLVIDWESDESSLLIGILGLQYIGVDIYLDDKEVI